jgi:hypothetical protein
VGGFYAMRLASAALNAALLASAFAMARLAPRFRLLSLATLVAVTPEVLQLAGSINPNSQEIAAGVLAWTSVCAAVLWPGPRIPRSVLVAGVVSCTLLALTRPLSDLWLAMIGLAALGLFGQRERVLAQLRQREVQVAVGLVAAAGVAGAVWTVVSDDLGNNRGYQPWDLGYAGAAQHSLALSWSYLQQMVAVFGWDRTPSPAPLTWAWGGALALLVGAAVARADRRQRRALVGLAVLIFLVPTLLQTPTAVTFGFVWSGRYWLAVVAGLPIAAALVLDGRWSSRATAIVATLAAGGHVVAHAAAMRRWTVGTDGPLNYLAAPEWHPPVSPVLLLLATAALASALAALAYRVAVLEPDA